MSIAHECGVFAHLDDVTNATLAEQSKSLVLGTDMAHHQTQLRQFKVSASRSLARTIRRVEHQHYDYTVNEIDTAYIKVKATNITIYEPNELTS